MQAKLKFKESEEEMQEFIALQMQKDLETKLIAELQEKLQFEQLEKKIVKEEETQNQTQEEKEEQKEALHGYGIETERFYTKEQGAYQVEQPYKKEDQE